MSTFVCSLKLFCVAVVLASAAQLQAGFSNSLMDISSDGKLLACSNRDSSTVTIIDLTTFKKLSEIAVGEKPEGVAFLGTSHRLAVAIYGEDKIVFVDADAVTDGDAETVDDPSAIHWLGSTDVFDEPYGLVSNESGSHIYVTLDFPGRVVEIDSKSFKVTREFNAGSFLRGIAISSDNSRLFVTEFYTSNVKAIDLNSGEVVDQWAGAGTDNLSRQIVLNPRRPKAYLPHLRSRVIAVHGEGSIFPYLSIIDIVEADTKLKNGGKRRTRIPADSAFGIQITSNPWEVAVSNDGRQLYLLFAGTNDMCACKIIDDDYREVELRQHMRLGSNPRAVRVSPDGNMVFVYNALDFEVVAYDTKTLKSVAQIRVTEFPMDEEILVGQKLFNTALQPMAGRRWISCSSCHPDGQPDGRTWHNPEGLRNTQSLGGMAWTHPIHWSADRDEVQDFEHTIRGQLMQGRGLIAGKMNLELGKPHKGLSNELDALAAYSNSHEISLSPFSKNGLSDSARRGQAVFNSEKTGCTSCHGGAFYSDSQPRDINEILRHDVGTGEDDATEIKGPAYDTPTLLGVYRTAPYLHHGKATTLEEVISKYNSNDQHGVTSHLTKEEKLDLVEFLKALPFEDPVAHAKNQGLRSVTR